MKPQSALLIFGFLIEHGAADTFLIEYGAADTFLIEYGAADTIEIRCALIQAANRGDKVPDGKLVEGQSNGIGDALAWAVNDGKLGIVRYLMVIGMENGGY